MCVRVLQEGRPILRMDTRMGQLGQLAHGIMSHAESGRQATRRPLSLELARWGEPPSVQDYVASVPARVCCALFVSVWALAPT